LGEVPTYALVSQLAKQALGAAFPGSAIDTERGFGERVHIRIVSSALNGMSERRKQAMVWDVLRDRLGTDAQLVSLVLPYGMDELP